MKNVDCHNSLRRFGSPVSVFLFALFSLMLTVSSSVQAQCDTCTVNAVANDNDDPWSIECYLGNSCTVQGNPCTANDVNMVGVFIALPNGDPVPTCMPGDMVTVALWGQFLNNSNADRYAVRTYTEVLLDGVCDTVLNGCSFDLLPMSADTALSLLGTITYVCGEAIELRRTWVGWETAGGATCANTSLCGDYASSKCSNQIALIEFLSPNFDFACGEITEDSTEVCFMNLTTGGTPPLAYSWDFGDGNFSTLEDPCHTFANNGGPFTVILTVIDVNNGDTVQAGAFLEVDLENLGCCTLDVVCPNPSPSILQCLEDVPLPTEDSITILDMCGMITVTIDDDTTGVGCINDTLVLTRTYFIVDDMMFQDTCTQVFRVVDNTAPTANCPMDTTMNCNADTDPMFTGMPTGMNDNCSGVVMATFEDDTNVMACSTVITRTWTFSDECGNEYSCDQIITLVDTLDPVCPVPPADELYSCLTLVPAPGDLTATDECQGDIIATGSDSDNAGAGCIGDTLIITRTWTFDDGCGNSCSVSQEIRVVDDVLPTFDQTCPNDTTVNCNAIPSAPTLTASDNCGTADVVPSEDSTLDSDGPCEYTITRTWTATDECGNTNECVQVITVVDTVGPVCPVPPIDEFYTCVTLVPPPGDLTATDECQEDITVTGSDTDNAGAGCSANPLIITRTWTFDDGCGNTCSVSQTITVADTIPPSISCPADFTLSTPESSTDTMFTGVPTISDNCGDYILEVSDAARLVNCPAAPDLIVRTFRAEDECGNVSSCTQLIYIPCPEDLDVPCGPCMIAGPASVCPTSVDTFTVSVDACLNPVYTWSVTNGAVIASGQGNDTITVTAPATCNVQYVVMISITCDSCVAGTSPILCSDTVTVEDLIPPSLSCPDNVILACGAATDPGSTGMPTLLSDNCSSNLEATFSDMGEGDACDSTILRTWSVMDDCGNVTTCLQRINIIDTLDPVCPIAPNDALYSCLALVPAPGELTAVDDCQGDIIETGVDSDNGGAGCIGDTLIITRTWTFNDGCDNSCTVSQEIRVIDDTPPMTTNCDPGGDLGCNPLTPSLYAPDDFPTWTDNCGVSASGVIPGTPTNTSGCTWSVTHGYWAVDNCLNSDTCFQTFTWILDSTPPMTTDCDLGGDLGCSPDPAEYAADDEPIWTDNCGTPTSGVVPGTPVNAGCSWSVTHRYWATDNCLNTDTCYQTFIWVEDSVPPSTTNCDPGGDLGCNPPTPSLYAADDFPTWTDDCGVINSGVVAGTPANTAECTWSVTHRYWAVDACMNSDTCYQTFTWVVDITPPTITTPEAGGAFECADEIVFGTATAADNCALESLTFSDMSGMSVFGTLSGTQEVPPNASPATGSVTGGIDTATNMFFLCVEFSGLSGPATAGHIHMAPVGINGGVVIPLPVMVGLTSGSFCIALTLTDAHETALLSEGWYVNIHTETIPGGEIRAQLEIEECGVTVKRTWIATDTCGNIAVANATASALDMTPPAPLVCPDDIDLGCNPMLPDDLPPPAVLTTVDNCDGVVTAELLPSDVVIAGCNATLVRYYRASDNCGNAVICSQVITWTVDTTPPSLTCNAEPVFVEGCNPSELPPAPPVIAANDNCSGPASLLFDGKYYSLTAPGTWQDVRNEAIALGGDLVAINSAAENAFLLASFAQTETVWIGYTDEASEGNFVWSNGDPNGYENWDFGEPNNLGAENYVEMYGGSGVWNDAVVTSIRRGIVETLAPFETVITLDTLSLDTLECQASVTYRYTATDACGNSAQCTQVVLYPIDTTPPQISECDDITTTDYCFDLDNPLSIEDLVEDIENDAEDGEFAGPIDNCGIDFFDADANFHGEAPGACGLVIRVQYFAVDNCGNTASCTQFITVLDITPPVLLGEAPIGPFCDQSGGVGFPSDSDCEAAVCGIDPFCCDVAWDGICADEALEFTECCNCLTIPTCPTGGASPCEPLTVECGDPIPLTPVIAVDNCDQEPLVTFSDSEAPGQCPVVSVITRTWYAIDDCGNTSSCTQIITITDMTPPAPIVCPADIDLGCNPVFPDDLPPPAVLTTVDICDGVITAELLPSDVVIFGCTATLVRYYRASDSCGNSVSCSQVITWTVDTTPPSLTCLDSENVLCGVELEGGEPGMPLVQDNCDADVSMTYVQETIPGDCPQEYSILTTWYAEDDCGNRSSCTQRLNIVDPVAPSIFCPSTGLFALNPWGADVQDIALYDVDLVDCTVSVDGSYVGPDLNIGSLVTRFGFDVNPVTGEVYLLASDQEQVGNSDRRLYRLDIVTGTTVEIGQLISSNGSTQPMDITFDGAGTLYAIFQDGELHSVNLTTLSTSFVALISTGGAVGITYDFDANRILHASGIFESIDIYEITLPGFGVNFLFNTTGNGHQALEYVGDDKLISSSTGGTNAIYSVDLLTGTTTSIASPTGTFLNIKDLMWIGGTQGYVECAEMIEFPDPSETGIPLVFDNCGTVTVDYTDVIGPTDDPCSPQYIIRTWSAVDECGNVATCNQLIDVLDTTPPEVSCPAPATIECDVTPDPLVTGTPTATDICSDEIVYTYSDEFTAGLCAGTGTIIRTWRAADECGNFATCTQIITLIDTTPPSLTIPADTVIDCRVGIENFPGYVGGVAGLADRLTVNSPAGIVGLYSTGGASFGPLLTEDPITADLQLANDLVDVTSDACEEPLDDLTGKIALIDRGGGCFFEEKVLRAETAGAIAVIIANNNMASPDLTAGMAGIDPIMATIPSVMVSYNTGVLLKAAMLLGPVNVSLQNTFLASVTDNCDPDPDLTYSDEIIAGDCDGNYTINRTWTATDDCGNGTNLVQVITVVDTVGPVITLCPEAIMAECSVGGIPDPDPMQVLATDDCSEVTVTWVGDFVVDQQGCGYTIIRTYRADDGCGNTTDCTQLIIVGDSVPPMITCPGDMTIECNASTDPSETGMATATDNCVAAELVTITYDDVTLEGRCAQTYTIVRTWRAMDECGNEATCTQRINVQDTTPPVFGEQDCTGMTGPFCDQPQGSPGFASNTECEASVCAADPFCCQTEWDQICADEAVTLCCGCLTPLPPCDQAHGGSGYALDASCQNAVCAMDEFCCEVSWDGICAGIAATLEECCGCLTQPTCNEACADITVECGDEIPVITPTVNDNCDSAPVVTYVDGESTPGQCPVAYQFVRTWYAEDDCGNVSTCQQIIYVEDTTPPNLTCPEASMDILTTYNGLPNGLPVNGLVWNGVTYTATPDAIIGGGPPPQTAIDPPGITGLPTMVITMEFDKPVSMVRYDFALCTPVESDPGSTMELFDANNNSLGVFTGAAELNNPFPFVEGHVTGNVLAVRAVVTFSTAGQPCGAFMDNLVYTCPGTGDLGCDPVQLPPPAQLTAVDECVGIVDVTVEVVRDDTVGCVGTLIYKYFASDDCDNTTTCTQTYTYTIGGELTMVCTKPAPFFCPEELPVPEELAQWLIDEGYASVNAEGCGDAVVEFVEFYDLNNNCALGWTFGFTATDACGNNADTCYIIVQIYHDDEAPILTCNNPPHLGCNPQSIPTAQQLISTGFVSALDGCGPASIGFIPPFIQTNVGCEYSRQYRFRATDGCGNQSEICIVTVNWTMDTTPPSLTCPADLVLECTDVIPDPEVATATDACELVLVTYVGEVGSGDSCDSLIVRTYYALDACGNESYCTQQIRILDTTPPAIECPGLVVLECGVDTIPVTSATVTDNCHEFEVTYVDEEFPQICDGGVLVDGQFKVLTLIVRTFYAVDECDNASSCTQHIIIRDDTPPTLTCPEDITIQCDQDPNNLEVTGAATAVDLCDPDAYATILITFPEFASPCSTVLVRIWEATDHCGNGGSSELCVQRITIVDTEAPTIACPGDVTIECGAPLPMACPIVSDNCAEIEFLTPVSGALAAGDLQTRVRFTNASVCNATACTAPGRWYDAATITITEIGLYTFTGTFSGDGQGGIFAGTFDPLNPCVNFVDGDDDDGAGLNPLIFACVLTPGQYVLVSTSFSCTNTAMTYSWTIEHSDVQLSFVDSDPVGTCPMVITRTHYATDACGNVSSCTQRFTIIDTTPPSIVCPVDVTIECGDPLPTTLATGSDICDDVTITYSDMDLDAAPIAVTFNGSALSTAGTNLIPSAGTGACSVAPQTTGGTIFNNTVSGLSASGSPVEVLLNLTHTFDGDLDIYLAAPNGQILELSTDNGSSGDHFTNTRFRGDGLTSITAGTAPFTGIFRPEGSLTASTCGTTITPTVTTLAGFTAGQNGTWQLRIKDDASAGTGTMLNWSITFNDEETITCGSLVKRTHVVTDECGNTSSCMQFIRIVDTTPPTITCPDDLTIECGEPLPVSMATASDICDADPFVTLISERSTQRVDGSCLYYVIRTFSAEDDCGLTTICTQVITIEDTTPPSISCPADATIECGDNLPTALAAATDICSEYSLTYTDSDAVGTCPMVITRTHYAIDVCGNTSSCTQYITIEDTTAPEIDCPNNVTIECGDPLPTTLASATDICSGGVVGEGPFCNVPSGFPGFPSNSACEAAVCADDPFCCDVAWDGICADNASQYAECASCLAGSSENILVTYTDSDPAGECPMVITRTHYAEDECGNVASCTQYIYIRDTTPPSITCPEDLTLECNVDPIPTTLATASDICDEAVDVTYVDVEYPQVCDNDVFVDGEDQVLVLIVRTHYATDNCGNVATCTQRILIRDDTPPQVTCVDDVTIECDQDPNDYELTGIPTLVDLCDPDAYATILLEFPVFTSQCSSVIQRVWIATDHCGNGGSGGLCPQLITIVDTTPPSITCPADATIECGDDLPTTLATGTDNCTDVSFTYSDSDATGECPVVIVRTHYASDECGNVSSCTQRIYIEDTTAPQITCPAPVTLECGDDLPTTLATAVDVCTTDIDYTYSDAGVLDGTSNCTWTIARTHYATDNCGNVASCIQIILIVDTTPPSITCPGDVTIECDEIAGLDVATASDICSPEVFVTLVEEQVNEGTCLYTIVRTYRAVDECGNAVTCTQVITVEDTTAPEVSCPANVTLDCPSATCLTFDEIFVGTDSVLLPTLVQGGITINITAWSKGGVQRSPGLFNTATPHPDDLDLGTPNIVYGGPGESNDHPDGYEFANNRSLGNILIVQQHNASYPNDHFLSDSIVFNFSEPVFMENVVVMDFEAPSIATGAGIFLFDSDGALISFTGFAGDGNDNSMEEVVLKKAGVKKMKLYYGTAIPSSGGIGSLCYVYSPCNAEEANASDACSDVSISCTDTTLIVDECITQIIRTYSAEDECGNVNENACTQVLTLQTDGLQPEVMCPADLTLACGDPVPAPDPSLVSATDNCSAPADIEIVWIEDIVMGFGCDEEIRRIYRATDECGNEALCVQFITREGPPLQLSAKVLLGGSMDPGAFDMYTLINNLLPEDQPYFMPPASYPGPEQVDPFPANIVDWVLVELRDVVTMEPIGKRSALVTSTGDIVDLDGVSPLMFTATPDQYYVVICHRNHLDIMSDGPVDMSGSFGTLDFTLGNNGMIQLANGTWAMIKGDVNSDGLVNNTDLVMLAPKAAIGYSGEYLEFDVNMDGLVNNTDLVILAPFAAVGYAQGF